jgi:hypothetical protein
MDLMEIGFKDERWLELAEDKYCLFVSSGINGVEPLITAVSSVGLQSRFVAYTL